ncbi:MAG: sigma-70 family RNA polymerase sigma factor [Planctomycetes bacterium]|nr:sigma-70 family RNA polymerase sigma factor [Planctomycetota bacterium]MBI3847586.1 sigma-70 family RNA polymerase sigma factor [Planctomycetota bacterium]
MNDSQPDFFPSTCWSRIVAGGPASRKPDLDALAHTYLRPIQAWLRCRLASGPDDAGDATQDFFVWMIETDFVSRADPTRGRFRAFLKTALRHFAVDRERKRRSLKQGGGRAAVPLHDANEEPIAVAAKGAMPDDVLDATWRADLVERATARLEQEFQASGKATTFLVFRDYFLAGDAELDHAAVAARHGLRLTDVSNHLRVAKRRFRELLREAVIETVGDAAELRDELRWLFEEGAR